VDYPPIVNLIGKGTQTFHIGVRNGPKSKRGWDLQTAKLVDGDGLVPIHKATIYGGVPHYVFTTKKPHREVLDTKKVKPIIEFLLHLGNNKLSSHSNKTKL